MSSRGRRIAFDYGDARIGVAICDPDGILATPLEAIPSHTKSRLSVISELLMEYQPIEIFIGLPKNMSGSVGTSVEKVEAFATEISTITSVKITFVDERLTSVDAQRRLREAGLSTRESKGLIDSMSAVLILEQGLSNAQR